MSDDVVVEEEEEVQEVEAVEEAVEAPVSDEEALGDPGKRALDAMKQKMRDAEKSAREAKSELAKIQAEFALKDKPVEEQVLETARREAAQAERAKVSQLLAKAELKAAATGKFKNPALALKLVDLSQINVSDDGDVDVDSINDAITDFLQTYPELAVVTPGGFSGSADQGAKGKPARVHQLAAKDLDSMSSDEIEQARVEGRLNDVLGIK